MNSLHIVQINSDQRTESKFLPLGPIFGWTQYSVALSSGHFSSSSDLALQLWISRELLIATLNCRLHLLCIDKTNKSTVVHLDMLKLLLMFPCWNDPNKDHARDFITNVFFQFLIKFVDFYFTNHDDKDSNPGSFTLW